MEIDTDRLRADIEANAEFGAVETPPDQHGRTVLAGTPADERARDYLVSRLKAAEMDVFVDGVGNILGRWVPAGADPEASPVVAGSHLDSVPSGGIFDGPLGVYAALEAVRAIQESDRSPEVPLAVVDFTEEEGSRFPPLTGSSVAAGVREVADAQATTDGDGVTLREAMADIGYLGDDRIRAADWDAWLEVHVEQGSRLEEAGVPVGVVTDITGISQLDVTLVGESDHAGTTSMTDRVDPLVGAAEVIEAVEDAALEAYADSPSVVGTVGKVDVSPNATNVIPEQVDLGIDIRDVDQASMDGVIEAVEETVEAVANDRGLKATTERRAYVDPTPMDDRAVAAIEQGAETAGVETLSLHSGAGHDTMHVAGATDAAMLFAPSRDGRSHSPREWTDWADCATATRVLAEAMVELAG
jgi:N-carbamoyl-L-amino-acid hydrolase